MEKNKIGTVTLTGLSVGPILGSGILILPPIIFRITNDWSIIAWLAIIAAGLLFAFIFGHLSILFPGDGGVTNAIEKSFGSHIKVLSSVYLILGVVFGAVAMLTTAAQYLEKTCSFPVMLIAYSLLILCSLLLLGKITFIGKVVFMLSLISASVLFIGGIATLVSFHESFTIVSPFDFKKFGYSLQLLIWTTLGWEVIGNYSATVRNPQKTIFRSIIASTAIIAIIDLTVASAVQWSDISKFWIGEITITTIMVPLFKEYSNVVAAALTLILCCSTYLLYAGGIIRLAANLSERKILPLIISKRNKNDIPVYAVLALFLLHSIVMTLVHFNFLNIEKLLFIANCFFIGNVFIGILTGILIIKNYWVKIGGCILGFFFLIMLLFFSSKIALSIMILTATYFIRKQILYNKQNRRAILISH